SRFGRGAIRPGGTGVRLEARADLASTEAAAFTASELQRNLELLANDVAVIDDRFLSSRMVRERLAGVGTVVPARAQEIGLVGLAARASGIPCDMRTNARGVYERRPIERCIRSDGDCWARARMRIAEIGRSLDWLRSLTDVPLHWRPARTPIGPLAPRHLVVA